MSVVDGSLSVYRMCSLSVDYILMLALAVILAVKYVVFDHDDDLQPDDATVTAAAVPASAPAGDKLNTSVVVNGDISAGHSRQIDDVMVETLHAETSDDITPTASSLPGQCSALFCL